MREASLELVEVLGPSAPVSVLEIRAIKPEHFRLKTGGWCSHERFSRSEKVCPGRIFFPKELIQNLEVGLNAAETVWCLIRRIETNNIRPNISILTASHGLSRHPVVVNLDERGLSLSDQVIYARDDRFYLSPVFHV